MKIQIAENIKRLRATRGLTQNDLAVLLSVSPQAVSRWENEQAFPDINLLPSLAKYLDVSIDELMGLKGQVNKSLKKELYDRRHATIDDASEKAENELRILDIYEELGHSELFYLRRYFEHLMSIKSSAPASVQIPEARIASARQMICERIRTVSMCERIDLLSTVAQWEDEDHLVFWAEEHRLPEYIDANLWDELLVSRYTRKKSIDQLNRQNQKLLYTHITSIISDLTDRVPRDIQEQSAELCALQGYKTALDTIALYSTRIDDIFIFHRILTESGYAYMLFRHKKDEEGLEMLAVAAEHISLLHALPEGTVLHGSVPILNTVQKVFRTDEALINCIMRIDRYERSPFYDRIRNDERLIAFSSAIQAFFPYRSFVMSQGESCMDPKWEMLLAEAQKEASALSDGSTVVMLTAQGAVHSISFRDMRSEIDAEGALKLMINLKKNGNAKIERLICMLSNGGLDIPSFSFREALLTVEKTNLSTKMLLQGLRSRIVKTVQVTMPRGYASN